SELPARPMEELARLHQLTQEHALLRHGEEAARRRQIMDSQSEHKPDDSKLTPGTMVRNSAAGQDGMLLNAYNAAA
ncbi:hypothetical protein OFL77_27815, partial [Escherichia coli]|uniref:hypothetical protein n=1 Tax=Escherichia coli TaxID=562 RepID=UPI0021E08D20